MSSFYFTGADPCSTNKWILPNN